MAPAHLSPDAAVLLLTLGLLLIYVELNRPGSILPGALGLLATLLSIASLLKYPLSPVALLLCTCAIAIYVLTLRRPAPLSLDAAAALALLFGLRLLVTPPSPQRVHTLTAVLCALLLGPGTSLLTRIAYRARANKALD